MKKLRNTVIVILVLIVLVMAIKPFYFLEEGELAVVTQFGRIVSHPNNAGIHFKTPLIDQVSFYPEKILAWDGAPELVPTKEKQFIWIDVTARWRIDDPATFYESITTMEKAYGRLDEVIDSSVRTVIAQNPLYEAVRNSNVINDINRAETEQTTTHVEINEDDNPLVMEVDYDNISTGRNKLSEEMLKRAAAITPQYGIELIDVVIRQIRYSDKLTDDVYNRMIAERKQIAQYYRSLGQGKRDEWLGKLEREKLTIISEAEATAEKVKGEADAYASRIYAQAYRQDPQFFEFWRAIQSYSKTLPTFRKTMSTDMDYFEYLYSPEGR